MEIITNGYYEGEIVLMDEMTCTYLQEADCTESNREEPQVLTLSTRDGGGGKFINIKTESWSINGDNLEDDLIPLIKDFKHRMDESFSYPGHPRKEILEESNKQ